MPEKRKTKLRSDQWFNNPKNPDMTALYLEKYMNYGLKRKDLQSGKPIIGIAQSGSDLSPCNRHFLSLSKKIKEGIKKQAVYQWNFQLIQYKKLGKDPQRCWIEIYLICH